MRGLLVTEELYDLILFTVHSFVAMTAALFALKYNDVSVQERTEKANATQMPPAKTICFCLTTRTEPRLLASSRGILIS